MGKDLRGKELGVGLYQRKDKRYSARYTNQYGKRMEFYDFKLSVVKKWLNDARYEDEHGLSGALIRGAGCIRRSDAGTG